MVTMKKEVNGMACTKMHKVGQKLSQEELTDLIRKTAQEIYENSGRIEGRDVENWTEAERIVKKKGCSC